MSNRDRRSRRIREQIRAHANPRSGQAAPRSLQEQLRRLYGGDAAAPPVSYEIHTVASELARIARRRR
jgi:hypothetical protein